MNIYEKALGGEALTKHEITALIKAAVIPDTNGNTAGNNGSPQAEPAYNKEELEKIYGLAHNITRKFMGNKFDSCSIINAKSGNCPEDCKWCAQSSYSKARIEIYPLITKHEAIRQASYNSKQGIKRFSLVTSGRKVSKKEVDKICEIVKSLPEEIIPCVSLGLIDKEDMRKLRDAGVTRYHCNIETAPGYFGNLCTTHTIEDKMATIDAAREAGMSICSGGIIGMGESMEDRIDMALFLRDNNILSIPINLLHPIPGTPLAERPPMSREEFLLSVSLFRIINPRAYLRFAGGRALISKEVQEKALYIGINSAIMGDLLTTLGSGALEDIEMFTKAGYDFFSSASGNDIEKHIWHPYSSVEAPGPVYFAQSAKGVKIKIADMPSRPESPGTEDSEINEQGISGTEHAETPGRELIDGMSSWWAAIHGYNHPELNKAAICQIEKMSHIMFGGFTHAPAGELTRLLLDLLPDNSLSKIFYSDSGSVSVEVALKMALQYWVSKDVKGKDKFVAVRNGYHGDTWNAMSVCDPVTGMHSIFGSSLPVNFFAPSPTVKFRYKGYGYSNEKITPAQEQLLMEKERQALERDTAALENIFRENSKHIAAFIIEPVVQGAGGMKFYTPEYLVKARELCDKYNILLIFDEIATGFGRTGRMFATEHTAGYTGNGRCVVPDIMTIGKGLTGGYLTLAATICTDKVAGTICNGYPGVFMHGPTFMANPLACAIACASVKELKKSYNGLKRIKEIEEKLREGLSGAETLNSVEEIRCLGAIGVIEMKEPVNLKELQPLFTNAGIWLRPFGKLVYMMPPYIISDDDLETLCRQTVNVLKRQRG